ncbi:MAG: hypothetical protein IJ814_02995 [Paludibacteraceae bacterium]|nr:hypothetical protein [Paludibacteraceae bacterium]
MTKKQQRHIIASVCTLLFLLLVFLLLWFIYLEAVVPEEQEGVEVAFGEVENAGGYMAQQSEAVPLPSPQPAAPQQASAPSDNDLLTQEDEESLALRKQQEEAEKARRQAEADRLQREREEQARLEKERQEREAAEAERKAKEAEAIAKANALGSLFGNNGSDAQGSGDGQGAGQKGNPVGHGSSGGNNWSLAGRGIHGTLPRPANTFNQEGQVIVEIRVNAAGTVINVAHKGGNISDKQTIQLALDAARKAKFTEGDHDQIGTITYNFKFN